MELKYIWIKDHNTVLNNLGVNFHHTETERFSYTGSILEIVDSTSKRYQLDFGNNIKGVNVIAGKNGAGKSSLCDLVVHALATMANGSMGWEVNFRGIVCFDNSIFYQEELVIENLNYLRSKGYLLYSFKETPLSEIFGQEYDIVNPIISTRFIYYSNYLDERGYHHLSGLSNISTQYLLFESIRESTYRENFDYINQHRFDGRFQINAFNELERDRVSRFVIENLPIALPIDFKDEIRLKNTYSEFNKYLRNSNTRYDEIERSLAFAIGGSGNDDDVELSSEFLKGKMIQLFRFNVLILLNKAGKEDFDHYRFVFDDSYFKHFDMTFVALIDCYISLVNESSVQEKYSKYHLESIAQDYGYEWKAWFFTLQNLYIDINISYLVRELLKWEADFLSEIEMPYVRIFTLQHLQNFSSGEHNYLSFFSRLHFAILPRHFYEDIERKHFNIFIDEVDGGFHPAWKKKLFKWILDYLTTIHPSKTFSLFFTTHSPYLISDIDSQNLILLDKEHGQTKVLSKESYKPFGANIHNLLADTFFMEDGFIGEFAKDKIQSIIDKLNNLTELKKTVDYNFGPEHRREIQECRERIDLIGDQFVRNKLIDIYFELVSDNLIIDNEIQSLQRRINFLKDRRGR